MDHVRQDHLWFRRAMWTTVGIAGMIAALAGCGQHNASQSGFSPSLSTGSVPVAVSSSTTSRDERRALPEIRRRLP